jgi:hypothetical protein
MAGGGDFNQDFNNDFWIAPIPPAGPPTGQQFSSENIKPQPPIVVPTAQEILTDALIDAGIVGIDESVEQPILNRAWKQMNWLLSQWNRKRFLVYHLVTVGIASTGATVYSVGKGCDFPIDPRPDRAESAFLRFLNAPNTGNLNVDIPIRIIQSMEDYNRITVKNIGTIAWQLFYDPTWPTGTVYPWPIPQASQYGIFICFKETLTRFASLQQKINLPPEYEPAIHWTMVRRLRASYQMPPDSTVNSLARDALNSIRDANSAVGVLQMPQALRNRNRAYDYRGDSDDFM